jgi:hypothetical protein
MPVVKGRFQKGADQARAQKYDFNEKMNNIKNVEFLIDG